MAVGVKTNICIRLGGRLRGAESLMKVGPMTGLTTNIEFGCDLKSGKVILGAPDDAENVGYMFYLAKENEIETSRSLTEMVQLAIKKANRGN